MQELDWVVGELLDKLDALGIADNTIVVFTSDNGAEKFSWPDGSTSPFRGEKGMGWEGGFRVPFLIRWPNHILAPSSLNGIVSLEDVVPTMMAAGGVPDVKEQLLTGYESGDKTFRVHLDGYNQLPYLEGETDESPRREFYYYGEHNLFAVRYNNWKVHFAIKDDFVSRDVEDPDCAAAGQPAQRSAGAAHGLAKLFAIRGRETVDRHASGRPPAAAHGHIHGLPATPGTARLQSGGDGAERAQGGGRSRRELVA